MRILKIVGVFFFLSAIAVVAFWHLFFRLPLPEYSGTEKLPGLIAEVTVKTDEYGIPHIFAQNEKDLFYTQGYITARERLFQMETTRLAGLGELSSIFGETTLDSDRFLKTFGFNRLAKAEFNAASDELKEVIQWYVAGVNQYIKSVEHLPREFTILRSEPGLWKPEDVISAGLLMAYGLTRSQKADLILYQIARAVGQDRMDLFMPAYPEFAPRVSDSENKTARLDGINFSDFPGAEPHNGMNLFSMGFTASNWMIYGGQKTASGKPIFTGSPDLEPKLPATFFVVHLKGGRYDVMGGAIPGTPGVSVLGYNGRIAWSTVNGRVDELDYYIEKVNPDNPSQYLTETGWENFEIIDEKLKIKGKKGVEERPFEIRSTRHGPIISGVLPLAPDNCAVKWVGQEPSGVFEGFLRICRAKNFNEFREGCRYIRTPTLNIGYADIDGHIGYQYVARPPIRKTPGGPLPMPGWDGEHEWTGHIAFEDLPWDLDPAKGYFGSFNNEAKPTSYHMTNFFLFERALRFREIMKDKDKLTIEDAQKIQLDTVSAVAERWVPLVVAAAKNDPDLKSASDMLASWNRDMDFDSSAASLFNAFFFYLMGDVLSDDVGKQLWDAHLSHPYLSYIADLVLIRIQNQPNHFLWDDAGTDVVENRDDMLRRSLAAAAADLHERYGSRPEKWAWGQLHQMTFKHPLGGKLSFFNLDPVPTRGDGATINAGMWDNKHPFDFKSGGVIRMIVDFAEPENSTIISPPGQSGQFKSPHYGDQAAQWARGEQIPMHFSSAEKLEKTLLLKP